MAAAEIQDREIGLVSGQFSWSQSHQIFHETHETEAKTFLHTYLLFLAKIAFAFKTNKSVCLISCQNVFYIWINQNIKSSILLKLQLLMFYILFQWIQNLRESVWVSINLFKIIFWQFSFTSWAKIWMSSCFLWSLAELNF